MITAKQARDGTKVDEYIKNKMTDVEESIKLSMSVGVSYYRHIGLLPSSIIEMLQELGYRVDITEDMFTGERTIISWGHEPKGNISCC